MIFEDNSYPKNLIDHPTYILYELTHYRSVDFELIQTVIPFDQDYVEEPIKVRVPTK